MESLKESINMRKAALEQWLQNDAGLSQITMQPLAGDASFRRYYRINTPAATFIAMDAPPPRENVSPFIAIAKALRGMGLNAPEIIHADSENGFLLITDFGDATYLKTLTAQNADALYRSALSALSVLQSCRTVPGREIPPFTTEFMRQEWAWHKEWFLEKLLGLQLGEHEKALDECYALIVSSAALQPQVFMHRDYHSANLMVLSEEIAEAAGRELSFSDETASCDRAAHPCAARSENESSRPAASAMLLSNHVGILDFQDAFIGPITYDLASLLRDCYIDWPQERVVEWALAYKNSVDVLRDVDEQTFLRWFDLMCVQRHLKALLTFARKHVRDQQSEYLQHIPRTLNYLLSVSARYPELTALHEYLQTTVRPAFERVNKLCAR